MPATQSSITALVTYNHVQGSHFELLIAIDHVVIHKLGAPDFYHVKNEELSIPMQALLCKIKNNPSYVPNNIEHAILANFHQGFTNDAHRMTML